MIQDEGISLEREYYKIAKTKGMFIESPKWHKYFLKTAKNFSMKPEWNPKKYIETLFLLYDKIYPTQLLSTHYWNEYVDNHNQLDMADSRDIKNIVERIFRDLSNIEDLTAYVKNSTDLFLSGNFNKYLFAFCKSFLILNKQKNFEYFHNDEILAKRAVLNKHLKVLTAMKQKMGDEFAERI